MTTYKEAGVDIDLANKVVLKIKDLVKSTIADYDGEMVGPDFANSVSTKYFNMRKLSIFGGSNEIQKNIIAKMILGL